MRERLEMKEIPVKGIRGTLNPGKERDKYVMLRKRNLNIMFVFVCAAFLFIHPVIAQEIKGPRIVLKEKVFDFGDVIQGEIIEHVFSVANHGNEALEIKNVKPD